ncbi:DUF3397 domain-containing protein [Jeotgalibacillus sp. S-D1]|uniref:DUF3397 domain-containing protein n=1 Tax=Jeotgalibacillus sp. S-D1 TaxID=2552189 RepID=UPI00105A0FAB|nr:DUF3397 domain-containing protein [Jeotgalibacillus sp. S-D1]TDL35131.1 DUF3397 domain-containing protein [Jeotgalibacillus sp. S-D1]
MSEFIAFLLGIFMILPTGVYVILFTCTKLITKHHKNAVNVAVYGTTPFAIGSVYFLILTIWEISLLWAILIVMALVGIFLSFFLWKNDPDFYWHKIFKGYWRLNFVIFIFIHGVIVLYGLIQAVIYAVVI